jgi:dolichyl-phosphate beta-glucosyltransferase
VAQQNVYLSLIVPAFNEAKRLPKTLTRLHDYLSSQSYTYEIIVVLDGPTDGTRDVMQGFRDEIPHLKIMNRSVNRGKGYTVKEGMLEASGSIRLFTDADNSTDIVHFERMKPLLEQGYDLVIASRNPKDVAGAQQAVPQAGYKRLMGRVGNLVVQGLTVRGVWDTQCGFKAFRANVAEQIFSRATIDGWGFDIEVLALARALGYKLGIIAADWINDDRSHFRFLDYVRVFGEIIKVKTNFLTRQYGL